MIFKIHEIKNYLAKQANLEQAITNLTEEAIIASNDYPTSALYERNENTLKKYEVQIGVAKLKEEQLHLRRTTSGKEGKYWMALSPRWIDEEQKKHHQTQYEIAYWVNYGDNKTYGWFTVEQIIKWLTTPELQLHTIGGTKER